MKDVFENKKHKCITIVINTTNHIIVHHWITTRIQLSFEPIYNCHKIIM
jgi:hypothetical protein